MAGPGRPPKTIQDLDTQLGADGQIQEVDVLEPPKKNRQKDRATYTFEMVGPFPKDPQNGTIRYPGLSLDNCQVVYDEETGVQRTARLIRGLNTFWMDEQKDIDPKYIARNKPSLSFNNGQIHIPATEALTVKFLMLRSDFVGCKQPTVNRKPRYKLVDTEAEEALIFDLKKKVKDAADKAWGTRMEDLIPHAEYLGIRMINDKGFPKSEDALRTDYVNKAEAQPDLFLRTYENPKVKMYGLVKKGFEQNVVIYLEGQALWADTKSMICQVPHSRQDNVADYLAELMLTKEGYALRSRLEKA